MSFHDVRLPVNIELRAVGGPGFKTNIIELSSGVEKRNVTWERTRGRWEIAYPPRDKEEQEKILAFFYARRGRAYGFRFRDWTDYQIGDKDSQRSLVIGEGDGRLTRFQIVKSYDDKFGNYRRPITRPVAGLEVFVDGRKQVLNSSFYVRERGTIEFATAPKGGEKISVITEFDVPVRFDTDDLKLTAFKENLYSIPSVSLVEIKEKLAGGGDGLHEGDPGLHEGELPP